MDLGKFEGLPVNSTSISVAEVNKVVGRILAADPQIFHAGDKRYLVLEIELGAVTFDPAGDNGKGWDRQHAATAKAAAFADGDAEVLALLEQQGDRIQAHRDKANGTGRLTPEVKISADHAAGLHKRRRKDCPECNPADLSSVRDPSEPSPRRVGGAKKRGR